MRASPAGGGPEGRSSAGSPEGAVLKGGPKGGPQRAVLRGRSFWARFFDLGVFLDGIEQYTRPDAADCTQNSPRWKRAQLTVLPSIPGLWGHKKTVENFLADL